MSLLHNPESPRYTSLPRPTNLPLFTTVRETESGGLLFTRRIIRSPRVTRSIFAPAFSNIQGTLAVALAAVLSAVKNHRKKFEGTGDRIFDAGSFGVAVVDGLRAAMQGAEGCLTERPKFPKKPFMLSPRAVVPAGLEVQTDRLVSPTDVQHSWL